MQEKQLERINEAKKETRTGTLTIASELQGKEPMYIPYISVSKVMDGEYYNHEIVKRVESVNRLKDSTFYERLAQAKKLKSLREAAKSITNRTIRRRK